MTTESLLPDPASQTAWGWFGYRGTMCDRAIKADNAPMLEECLQREFFEPDAQMLNFKTIRQHCKEFAPSCYAMLQRVAPEVD